MTDDDDLPEDDLPEDDEREPRPARSRVAGCLLIPILIFAVALAVGLVAGHFLVGGHTTTQAATPSDVPAVSDVSHRQLPAPAGGDSISLPAPSSVAANASQTSPAASDAANASPAGPASADNAASTVVASPAGSVALAPAGSPEDADSPPEVVERSNLEYPADAVQAQESGVVRVKVSIDAQGNVADVRIAATSGSTSLDRAAVESVKTWHYKAAMLNGQPAAGVIEVPVEFRLGEQK